MTASSPSPAERGAARSIDDLLVNVSASRLSTWQQCRLKFYFRYILAVRRPKPPALHVGSSIHETLKYWNKARWRSQQPSLKELHDIYSTSWETNLEKEPVKWFGEEAEQKQTGWKLLETYFRESPIKPDEKPEGVEVSVQASLSKHGLPDVIGIIDLVRPTGRIVDFKSTGKTPDPLQVAHTTGTQIACYSLLYREAHLPHRAGSQDWIRQVTRKEANSMEQITLYYSEGSSDKIYQASIEPSGSDKYVVNFAYGRRGSTLQTGTKTPAGVAFDLLHYNGNDLRSRPFGERYLGLKNLLGLRQPEHIKLAATEIDAKAKTSMLERLKTAGKEGVVFKKISAPYVPGRPATGGDQLKYKFYESASFIVAKANAKRSVLLQLFDGHHLVAVGNVTIPPNQKVPAVGAVVEVRYLYAFRNGAVFQPTYLGVREDIAPEEATISQFKWKAE